MRSLDFVLNQEVAMRLHKRLIHTRLGWAAYASTLSIALVLTSHAGKTRAEIPGPQTESHTPLLFLDLFKQKKEPSILTKKVSFLSAVGSVDGYLARPDTVERLPGVLLIPGEDGLNDWMKENAVDLS